MRKIDKTKCSHFPWGSDRIQYKFSNFTHFTLFIVYTQIPHLKTLKPQNKKNIWKKLLEFSGPCCVYSHKISYLQENYILYILDNRIEHWVIHVWISMWRRTEFRKGLMDCGWIFQNLKFIYAWLRSWI